MVSKEIKCGTCGKWTDGSKSHCTYCGSLVDFKLIDIKERELRNDVAKQKQLENQSKFEKLLNRLENSQKPFYRILFQVLNVVWIIYSALIAFVIWFTAIFSG
jgi:hypothetical protein